MPQQIDPRHTQFIHIRDTRHIAIRDLRPISLTAHDSNRVEKHFTITDKLNKRFVQSSAQISLHVQNYDQIKLSELRLMQHEFSQDFDNEITNAL